MRLDSLLASDIRYCNAMALRRPLNMAWDECESITFNINWDGDEMTVPYEVHVGQGGVYSAYITLPNRTQTQVFDQEAMLFGECLRGIWIFWKLVLL